MATNGQFLVNMKFLADTKQAESQIRTLQRELQQITQLTPGTTPSIGRVLSSDLMQAQKAASELKVHLTNAFNVNTGRLNLTKFQNSLRESGMSLKQYQAQLTSIGPAGQAAFQQIARQVVLAEKPVMTLGQGMNNLLRTFGNTARYMLSTAVISGITRAFSDAFSYVKDLNKSLNDIRIVTGYSADEMEKFAKSANKAAKELSVATNEYAKASLIYFQQGLDYDEVERRTAATVKMAQVTGQAMEETSDQLTAVWNNFYNGSKSLEYYADVITALGAATASSSDEITEGLEKFAAIAETVGLSYEYATSALATVTAATRQSADVVGTAFKTLFARIQDLELGETLEDGTTLGQYSEALAVAGVNIKDASGEMRDMDDILNDLAKKWDTLSGAQQAALAQTVAGVRQYTHLIALMENWSSMQDNLTVAYNSTGTLSEQAKIYEESWQAASDRLKASFESIYDQLLDDDAFINMTDALADVVSFISQAVEGVGGLKGAFSMLAMFLLRTLQPQIHGLGMSLHNMTPWGKAEAAQTQADARAAYTQSFSNNVPGRISSNAGHSYIDAVEARDRAVQSGRLSEAQQQVYTERLKDLEQTTSQAMEAGRTAQDRTMDARRSAHLARESASAPKTGISRDNIISAYDKYGIGYVTQGDQVLVNSEADLNLRDNSIEKLQNRMMKSRSMTYEKRQQIAHEIRTLDPYATNVNEQIQTMQQTATQAANIRGIETSIDTSTLQLSQETGDIQQQSAAVKDLIAQIDALKQAYAGADGSAEAAFGPDGLADLNAYEAKLQGLQTKLGQGKALTPDQVKSATKLHKDFAAEADTLTAQSDGARALAQEFGGVEEHLVAAQGAATQAGEAQAQAADRAAGAIRRNKQAVEELEASHRNVTLLENFSNLAQGISSVTMALSSLRGLWDTWSNTDTSFWDKLLTTVTTIGMTIPMVTMGITALNNARKNSIGLQIKETLTNALNTLALDAETKAKMRAKKASDIEQKENKESIAGNLGEAGSNGVNGGTQGSKGTVKTTAGSWKSLGQAFVKALPKLGMWAAAIAITVATIALAAHQITLAQKEMEKAQARVVELSKAYEDAAGAYSTLIETVSAHNEATENIKKLTKGTVEYEEALLKANEQAMQLIESNEHLASTVKVDDGAIYWDKEDLEKAQRDKLQQQQTLYTSKMSAQIIANDKEAAYLKQQFARKELRGTGEDGWGGVRDVLVAGGSGAASGALAGTAVQAGIGTLVGAIIGSVVGVAGGIVASATVGKEGSDESKVISAIADAVAQGNNSMLASPEKLEEWIKQQDELKDINSGLISALGENLTGLRELTAELAKNQNAAKEQWIQAFLNDPDNVHIKNDANARLIAEKAYSMYQEDPSAWGASAQELSRAESNKMYLIELLGQDDVTGHGKKYKGQTHEIKRGKVGEKDETGHVDEWGDRISHKERKDALQLQFAYGEIGAQLVKETYGNSVSELKKELTNDTRLSADLINMLLTSVSSGKEQSLTLAQALEITSFEGELNSSNEEVNKFFENYQEQAKQVAGYSEEILTWWKNLTPDERQIALQVHFDEFAAEKEFDRLWELAKSKFETQAIQLKFEGRNTFLSWLEGGGRNEVTDEEFFEKAEESGYVEQFMSADTDYTRDINGNIELTDEGKIKLKGTLNETIREQIIGANASTTTESSVNTPETREQTQAYLDDLYQEREKRQAEADEAKARRDKINPTQITVGSTVNSYGQDIIDKYEKGYLTAGQFINELDNAVKAGHMAQEHADYWKQLYAPKNNADTHDYTVWDAYGGAIIEGAYRLADGQTLLTSRTWDETIADSSTAAVATQLVNYMRMSKSKKYGSLTDEEIWNKFWLNESYSDRMFLLQQAEGGARLGAGLFNYIFTNENAKWTSENKIVTDWYGTGQTIVTDPDEGTTETDTGDKGKLDTKIENAENDLITYAYDAEQALTDAQTVSEQFGGTAEDVTEALDILSKEFQHLDEETLVPISQDIAIANAGFEEIESNSEKWLEAMAKGGPMATKAWGEVKTAVGKVLGIYGDTATLEGFSNTHTELINSYLNGTATVEDLTRALVQYQAEIVATELIAESAYDGALGLDEAAIIANVTSLYDQISALPPGQIDLDTMPLIQALATALKAAGWVEEEIVNLFQGMRIAITTTIDENGSIIVSGATSLGSISNWNFNPKTSDSSGSSRSEKEKKILEDEIERYHAIKQLLEDLERQYDRLSKEKDRAFGVEHLALLEQEISKMDELIDSQEKYVQEIQTNLLSDYAKLGEYGASFDESGRIINYDEMVKANVEQYNKAVSRYNAGSMSDEQFQEYEKEYQEFINDIKKYEETLNLLESEEEALADKRNERFDLLLEKVEYTVELGTGLIEDHLSLIDYQLTKIEDKAYEAADALVLLGQKMSATAGKSDVYRQAIADTLSASGIDIEELLRATPEQFAEIIANSNLTAQQIEMLREHRDELLATNEAMRELAEEELQTIIDAFDAWNEKIDKNITKLGHLNSVVKKYNDIIGLVGKDTLGISDALMESLNRATVQTSQAQLQAAQTQLASNQDALNQARAILNSELSEEERKQWEKVVEDLEQRVEDGEAKVMDAWKDALQAATDSFKASLETISDIFNDAVAGMYESLEALKSAYDQRTTLRDNYLADYEKIYELSKLTRDITKSIDDSDSVRAKNKLREIQEEIYALQESGAEMTEYEVEALRAKYELRLAEIALEEAQNAKSQVRMQRDSEGNWGYVYTADEDTVAKAEQNYEDKLYAFQNLTQDNLTTLEQQWMELSTKVSSELSKIMSDTSMTPEEKKRRKEELIKYYVEQQNYLKQQISGTLDMSNQLYTQDWLNYSQMTGYKISEDNKWIDSFDETVYAQLTGFASIEEASQVFLSSLQSFVESADESYNTWEQNVATAMDIAGTSVQGFSTTLSNALQDIAAKSEEYQNKIEQTANDMASGTEGLFNKAADIWQEYARWVSEGGAANENLANMINKVVAACANATDDVYTLGDAYKYLAQQAEAAGANVQSVNSTGGGSIQGSWNPLPTTVTVRGKDINGNDDSLTISAILTGNEQEMYYYQSDGAGGWTVYKKNTKTGKYNRILTKIDGQDKDSLVKAGMLSWAEWKKAYPFDTGGYTGSWGSSGRLALLHQKEIVLNARDTENFLSAINIVRDIAKVIDLNASAQSGLLNLLSTATVGTNEQALEQNVTIHAEFPHATDRNEIKEALNSLMNHASQFANRKN